MGISSEIRFNEPVFFKENVTSIRAKGCNMVVVIFAFAFRTLGTKKETGPWLSAKNKQTMLEAEKGVARMEMARVVITLQRNIGKSEGNEINL